MKRILKSLTLFSTLLVISHQVMANNPCDNSMISINNFTDQDLVIDKIQINKGSHVDNLSPQTTIPPKNQLVAYAHPNNKQQAYCWYAI